VWQYVYRAVDQRGQVIDVLASRRRDIASARRFFATSLLAHRARTEVVADRATSTRTTGARQLLRRLSYGGKDSVSRAGFVSLVVPLTLAVSAPRLGSESFTKE
jgi:transposase-like protein